MDQRIQGSAGEASTAPSPNGSEVFSGAPIEQPGSPKGFDIRLAVMLLLLAGAGVALFVLRPDLALQSNNSLIKGPATVGVDGTGVDWFAKTTANFLNALSSSDWHVALRWIPTTSAGGPNDPSKADGDAAMQGLLTRFFGFEVKPDKVEEVYAVFSNGGRFAVASLKEKLPQAEFDTAWKPSGTSHYGVDFHKAIKPSGLVGLVAVVPNEKCFVVGTNEGVLKRVVADAVARAYPIRDDLWPKEKNCVVVNDLRFLRSPLQAAPPPDGGGGRGGKGGLLEGFRIDDWAKDIVSGKVVIDDGVCTLKFEGKDDKTTTKMKEALERLVAAAGAKAVAIPPGNTPGLSRDKTVVSGKLTLSGSLPLSLVRLLEAPKSPAAQSKN